jgi:hypothetical protein
MPAAVTACTIDFTTGTLALLRSLARHAPNVERYCFALPDQAEELAAVLGSLATVRPIPRRLANAPADPKVIVSWSRVFIPTIAADAVAWLDSDVLLTADARAWWEVPAGQVNAVADAAYRIRQMVPEGFESWYFQQFRLDPDAPGFNAGIVALRPAEWPDLAERFESCLSVHAAKSIPFAFDQGLLNGIFQPRVNWLPREYNAHCLAECGVPNNVRAIHYTGSPKPWNHGYDQASAGYVAWLRHGVDQPDEAAIARAERARRLAVPRRMLGRVVRKCRHLLGHRDSVGVGRKPGT